MSGETKIANYTLDFEFKMNILEVFTIKYQISMRYIIFTR